MNKEIHKWQSNPLQKEMEVAVYGHYGYPLLMFPAAGSDYMEYERSHVIEAIAPFIDGGTIKVYSINSVDGEGLLNETADPQIKTALQGQFNAYVTSEVVPFIFSSCNGEVPIVAAGTSVGAYHAVNSFFRRPDLFKGVIALSGTFDIRNYIHDYFDDNCYFNSPVDYLPNLMDNLLLEEMRKGKIILASGQGTNEDPNQCIRLSGILSSKDIPHVLDLWGHDMPHDWDTWKQMLPFFLDKIDPAELFAKSENKLQDKDQ